MCDCYFDEKLEREIAWRVKRFETLMEEFLGMKGCDHVDERVQRLEDHMHNVVRMPATEPRIVMRQCIVVRRSDETDERRSALFRMRKRLDHLDDMLKKVWEFEHKKGCDYMSFWEGRHMKRGGGVSMGVPMDGSKRARDDGDVVIDVDEVEMKSDVASNGEHDISSAIKRRRG